MANYGKKSFSMTQYLRIQSYLRELQLSERACIFQSFSGHVDWVDITVTEDKKNYGYELYKVQVNLPRDEHDWSPNDWKKTVDDIIADIEDALAERENKIAKQNEENEAREKKRYEPLKAKYEPNA